MQINYYKMTIFLSNRGPVAFIHTWMSGLKFQRHPMNQPHSFSASHTHTHTDILAHIQEGMWYAVFTHIRAHCLEGLVQLSSQLQRLYYSIVPCHRILMQQYTWSLRIWYIYSIHCNVVLVQDTL